MIIIRNLEKNFQGKAVLRGIDLEIEKGEIMVIMGASGCGKSTILRHLIGLLKPDRGEIYLEGQEISKLSEEELNPIRRNMGMVFQNAALFDSLTVRDNVAFGLKYHTNLSQEEQDKIVAEKLAMVGLAGRERLMPAELSGGMQKRVSLARAIALNPKIILYDEPTSGLDPIMSSVIDQLILKMKAELAVTSVVVTHNMSSAFKIADRIAMLHQGQVLQAGKPEEIKKSGIPLVQQFIHGTTSAEEEQ